MVAAGSVSVEQPSAGFSIVVSGHRAFRLVTPSIAPGSSGQGCLFDVLQSCKAVVDVREILFSCHSAQSKGLEVFPHCSSLSYEKTHHHRNFACCADPVRLFAEYEHLQLRCHNPAICRLLRNACSCLLLYDQFRDTVFQRAGRGT